MPVISDSDLLEWFREEEAHPFEGWDFSHISDRMQEHPPPWDYMRMVREVLARSQAMLDMGTGGGERLASLAPFPPVAHATEGYPPNVGVARRRLEPLGVTVSPVADDAHLPFADQTFDPVINRHESYDPREVHRILQPGGRFITQQVGAYHNAELNVLLGAPRPDTNPEWKLGFARGQLEEVGFRIEVAMEASTTTRFSDVGAVVYYLKAAPWQIGDFTVERYFERLKALHSQIQAEGSLEIGGSYFVLTGKRKV
jgi:SAM-dependent methyltransferase